MENEWRTDSADVNPKLKVDWVEHPGLLSLCQETEGQEHILVSKHQRNTIKALLLWELFSFGLYTIDIAMEGYEWGYDE